MKKMSKGFTLVELMIVVAIIGILAAIAIPNFVKYQLRTKASEAGMLIESLRKAEAALLSDPRPIVLAGALAPNYTQNQYWNLNGVKFPTAGTVGTARLVWDPANDVARALAMDWSPEGSTYYDYQVTVAGCPGVPATGNSGVCFQVGASADIDGDGVPAWKTLVRPSNTGTLPSAVPANITGAALGTVGGTCGAAAATAVLNTYCSYTGPDVF